MGKSFVYNSGSSEDDKKEDELRLCFGVFIDGTLNNKENTRLRREYRKENADSTLTKTKMDEDLAKEKADYKALKKRGFKLSPAGTKQREYEEYLIGIHRDYMDKLGTNNSYSNDDTNVTRMWNYCNRSYRIYIEGMGTSDRQYDSQDGFAFGSGRTGIRARVRLACERITEKIQSVKDLNDKQRVTQITLDVFGFSRGAASARNFVHEVNVKIPYAVKKGRIPDGYKYVETVDRTEKIQKYRDIQADADGLEIDSKFLVNGKMPRLGHLGYSLLKKKVVTPEELENIKIIIRFIGVYDTVSSYYEIGALGAYDAYGNLEDDSKFGKLMREGWATHFTDDEKELSLHDLGGDASRFEKMVHLTALDEHRRNFALTRINQIPGIAIEKNLPGVHCDIGGAYENEEEEFIDEIGTNISDNKLTLEFLGEMPVPSLSRKIASKGLDALKEFLINQHWYYENELEIRTQFGWIPPITSYKKLTGTRKYIKKEYSYIALHFMEEYCRKTGMENFMSDKCAEKYPLPEKSFLAKVKENLHKYVFDQDNNEKEWIFKTEEQLKKENEEQVLFYKINEALESGTYEKEQIRIPTDNLNPEIYKPKIILPKFPEPEPTELPEVIITAYNKQEALIELRHKYLHWSSNRDWFGMEPNTNRKRVYYPKP